MSETTRAEERARLDEIRQEASQQKVSEDVYRLRELLAETLTIADVLAWDLCNVVDKTHVVEYVDPRDDAGPEPDDTDPEDL